jgi:GntR family transcriptional regulator/MocR family aminotransferase
MRTTFAQPRLDQLALAEFIARGYLDRRLRRARAAYRRRRELVARTLPTRGPAAGLFVHVPLPQAADEGRVLRNARAAGIALDGVRANAMGTVDPGVVLGFAASPEPSLDRALAILAPLIGGA